LLLTWVAGFVDALGYLYIYNIYVAHMSGNTVAMARHLAHMHGLAAVRHAWPIAVFIVGMIAGSILFEAQIRGAIRWRVPSTLALETVCLAVFVYAGVGADFTPDVPPQPAVKYYFLVALLTLAMGLQNVSIRKVGGLNIYTTFVTGSLVKFAESVSDLLFWMSDRLRGRGLRRLVRIVRLVPRNAHFHHAALTFSLWIAYLLGALAGVAASGRYQLLAMVIPLAVLFAVTVYATIRPFILLIEERW